MTIWHEQLLSIINVRVVLNFHILSRNHVNYEREFITLDTKLLELSSKVLSTSYARISIHK